MIIPRYRGSQSKRRKFPHSVKLQVASGDGGGHNGGHRLLPDLRRHERDCEIANWFDGLGRFGRAIRTRPPEKMHRYHARDGGSSHEGRDCLLLCSIKSPQENIKPNLHRLALPTDYGVGIGVGTSVLNRPWATDGQPI